MLEKELKYFEDHKEELLKHYENQFVLIKDDQFIGAFTTEAEAYAAGIQKFGNQPFLISVIGVNLAGQSIGGRDIIVLQGRDVLSRCVLIYNGPASPQGGHGDVAVLALPSIAVDDLHVPAGDHHVVPRHVEQVGHRHAAHGKLQGGELLEELLEPARHRLLAAVHAAGAHVAREHEGDVVGEVCQHRLQIVAVEGLIDLRGFALRKPGAKHGQLLPLRAQAATMGGVTSVHPFSTASCRMRSARVSTCTSSAVATPTCCISGNRVRVNCSIQA